MDGADPKPAEGILRGKAHLFPVRVYFESTDAPGLVSSANSLPFMERPRADMLRATGFDRRAALAGGDGS